MNNEQLIMTNKNALTRRGIAGHTSAPLSIQARIETQAPFNSPEGGKCSPPSEGLGEANAQRNARITNLREQNSN